MSKILESEGFTRSEVAQILRCSRSTVRTMEKQGILYSELQGNRYVIDACSLYDYITAQEQEFAEIYLNRVDNVMASRKLKVLRKRG